MSTRKDVAVWCGLIAPVFVVGSVLLATLLAAPETFTWRERALSDMGRVGTRTFLVFNGGLFLGGLIGLPFLWYLWCETRTHLERVGVILTGIAIVGVMGVGVFFLGHTEYYLDVDLHGIAALTFFVTAPIAQWVVGTGQVFTEDRLLALASFWSGIIHPIVWIAWLLYRGIASDPMAWFAIPEFVAATAFAGWIAILASVLLLEDRQSSARIF